MAIESRSHPSAADLARAARILAVRTRREATGIFAGSYASAFRGGGMEFDESRPYVPGDDVRSIDWNALARTGEPFVKQFREERDQLLLLALDCSSSMAFSSCQRTKAATAAHATALLAAAASRAGDRVGLMVFDEEPRTAVRPARGPAHTWGLIRTAIRHASSTHGSTNLSAATDALTLQARQRAVVVLLSDYRVSAATGVTDDADHAGRALLKFAARHDVVSVIVYDPREEQLPPVGTVRIENSEQPGRSWLLDTSSRRVRAGYARAWAARRRSLDRSLRSVGCDVLWMRNDHDPLRSLMRYFRERAARWRAAA